MAHQHTYQLKFHQSLYWTLAVFALWYCRKFWNRGMQGEDVGGLIAAALFIFGIRNIFKAFIARDQWFDRRKALTQAHTHTATEGKSRWADWKALKAFGMTSAGRGYCEGKLWLRTLRWLHPHCIRLWEVAEPVVYKAMTRASARLSRFIDWHDSNRLVRFAIVLHRKAAPLVAFIDEVLELVLERFFACWLKTFKRIPNLYIGTFEGKKIYVPTETSLLTVAQPGTGKGTSIVITNLLNYPGSMVVTDPKGELYAVTARHRKETLKHRILTISPWAAMMSRLLGVSINDCGFNPLAFIRPNETFRDDCKFVCSSLLPAKDRSSASDDFWRNGAHSLMTGVMMHLFTQSKDFTLTLPQLREALHMAPPEMEQMFIAMKNNTEFSGAISEAGGKLLGVFQGAQPQFQGWLGVAQEALELYDSGSALGAHVSGAGFDFASMKTVPTTVYIMMPATHSTTHKAWLNLVVSTALECVGRDMTNRRVLFLLDEIGNAGHIQNLLKAIAQYRGHGVQVWPILQSLAQIKQIYGMENFEQFMATIETINFFGVTDLATCKYFSEVLGNDTIRNLTFSMGQGQPGAGPGKVDCNASDKAAPLMRPDEIRTMPSDEQIILFRNAPPIRAKKLPYFRDKTWSKQADPNPYLRK